MPSPTLLTPQHVLRWSATLRQLGAEAVSAAAVVAAAAQTLATALNDTSPLNNDALLGDKCRCCAAQGLLLPASDPTTANAEPLEISVTPVGGIGDPALLLSQVMPLHQVPALVHAAIAWLVLALASSTENTAQHERRVVALCCRPDLGATQLWGIRTALPDGGWGLVLLWMQVPPQPRLEQLLLPLSLSLEMAIARTASHTHAPNAPLVFPNTAPNGDLQTALLNAYETLGSIEGVQDQPPEPRDHHPSSWSAAATATAAGDSIFEAIFDQAAVGIMQSDLSGCYLRVNPAFANMVGYSYAELLHMRYQDLTYPDDMITDVSLNQTLLNGHRHSQFSEKRYVCKDGSLIWASLCLTLICDEEGNPHSYAGIIQNIHERKLAQQLVQDNEARLRLIIQRMPILLNAADEQGNLVAWNAECERVTGYSADEIILNPHAWELLYPNAEYRAQQLNEMEERGHNYQDWEWDLTCKDGSMRTIAWSNVSTHSPIPNWQVWGVGVDVTERNRTMQQLQQLAQQQRAIAQLGQQALAGTEPVSLMQAAVALVSEALNVEHCKAFELMPDGTTLLLRAVTGWDHALIDHFTLSVDTTSFPGYTLTHYLRQTEAVAVEEGDRPGALPISTFPGSVVMHYSPQHDGTGLHPSLFQSPQIRSGISIPIVHASTDATAPPVGVITACTIQPRSFTPEDGFFLQAIARILSDAVQRHRAEAGLRHQAEVLQTIVDHIPVMLVFQSASGQVELVNPAMERTLGWQKEDFEHEPVIEKCYPNPADCERAQHHILNGNGTWEDFEVRTRDGRLLSTTWANIRLDDGRILGIGQDITERKRIEQEIRHLNADLERQVAERTEELRAIFNTLPDYIFVIDRADMRIRICNAPMANASGFGDRHQLEGKPVVECFPPEQAAYFMAQNHQVFESGETLRTQETLDLPIGTLHLDTFKIPVKRPNGEVYGLVGSSRDITELVQARQALAERTRQLEAINQELESFSYSVSHDLRAPLRHISGFVAALGQQLTGTDAATNPKVLHYLSVIQHSSQKMGKLIDGLLTLSRLGRRQMQMQPVPLRPLVERAIAITLPASSTPTATPQISVGELPTILGDENLLQQVFSNLLDNAFKFSQGANPPRIDVGTRPDGTLFVRDNGLGFEMKYVDVMFGAFQRLHSQPELDGHGIGLAIVQRIVHRHGGEIWAESTPGQGACFYLTFPSAAAKPDS
ncbi:MAG: PAS domain S-box protein [Kaiparowitsia implicata GSE-PSE-MK54-09C]|nr:PAS domain S-box protein [Kaiparowitsia implicata GSE-PSE-MK54-09C]